MTAKVQADLIARLRDLLERVRPFLSARIADLDDQGADTTDAYALLDDIHKALR